MKILLITDIHSDYDAAISSHAVESPDLVLDSGDHTEFKTLFGVTPHFYIRGNHEPSIIACSSASPSHIPNGTIIEFSKGTDTITFSGIDGNYGAKETIFQVNPKAIAHLKELEPHQIDIMLLHESPFNVSEKSKSYPLAQCVIAELSRLKPKYIFSGHTNVYSDTIDSNQSRWINLDDMRAGYGVLEVSGKSTIFERKRAVFGRTN